MVHTHDTEAEIGKIRSLHNSSTGMQRILMEDGAKPTVDAQQKLNPPMKEVVRKEIVKWLDAGVAYPISDSSWVSPVQVVPKKGGMMVVKNEKDELISTRTVTGWWICIDYRKLNKAMRKDHFLSLLLIRCWTSWQGSSIIVS